MQTRTAEELASLKADWTRDPCWDLDQTEGYEAHADELRAYQADQEAKWKEEHQQRVTAEAERLGCPAFPELGSAT